jgi:hypothetical protein
MACGSQFLLDVAPRHWVISANILRQYGGLTFKSQKKSTKTFYRGFKADDSKRMGWVVSDMCVFIWRNPLVQKLKKGKKSVFHKKEAHGAL